MSFSCDIHGWRQQLAKCPSCVAVETLDIVQKMYSAPRTVKIDCQYGKADPKPRKFVIDSISLQAFEIQDEKIFVEYRGTAPRNPIYVTQDSAQESGK